MDVPASQVSARSLAGFFGHGDEPSIVMASAVKKCGRASITMVFSSFLPILSGVVFVVSHLSHVSCVGPLGRLWHWLCLCGRGPIASSAKCIWPWLRVCSYCDSISPGILKGYVKIEVLVGGCVQLSNFVRKGMRPAQQHLVQGKGLIVGTCISLRLSTLKLRTLCGLLLKVTTNGSVVKRTPTAVVRIKRTPAVFQRGARIPETQAQSVLDFKRCVVSRITSTRRSRSGRPNSQTRALPEAIIESISVAILQPPRIIDSAENGVYLWAECPNGV